VTLLQTILLAAALLCAAAGVWYSATACRDRPLLIVANAAVTAAIIAAILPELRVLGLAILAAGTSIAYFRSVATFTDRERAKRTSAEQRDSAGLTTFFVIMPIVCTALYAMVHALRWPGEPPEPWLPHTLTILPAALLTSAAFAVRALVWPAIAARFAAEDGDPSAGQRIMLCAVTAPPFALAIGMWMLLTLGAFGRLADDICAAGYHVAGWTAAALTVPGFPLAWWWAARAAIPRRPPQPASDRSSPPTAATGPADTL
jgi:hypothetical protein